MEKVTTWVGVDGCKYGWCAFIRQQLDTHHYQTAFHLFDTLASLKALLPDNACVFIDMPIGFPAAGELGRQCDKLARQWLPGRAASVFPVPCEAAVYAADYQTACDINQQQLGKRFPIQTWNIIPKIIELDQLLQTHKASQPSGVRFYESHPELVFTGFAGQPMQFSKATEEGRDERLALLAQFPDVELSVLTQALTQTAKKWAKADDILDAFILLVAATQQAHWQFLPSNADPDPKGRPRQIVFVPKHAVLKVNPEPISDNLKNKLR
ncbi:DUF429 domain-containing protein [Alishewanella tabrizica]|uniref:DUF429 domain-containing protein n=1 Tax=Alishewanella tabrizica TaxID=671278 RepID=A0ABQ2WLH8_9ALTE|nr:DUF429 domain-containing protein [Alishewanella tabrizica]GGW56953.1 hypothetical protein GCM10008111_11180 [Alishewanella tabrizica]